MMEKFHELTEQASGFTTDQYIKVYNPINTEVVKVKVSNIREDGSTPVTYYSKKTILTNEQIKTLPTTGVELIPAPGTGKALQFVAGLGILKHNAGAYGNMADDVVGVGINIDGIVTSISNLDWILPDNSDPVGAYFYISQGGNVGHPTYPSFAKTLFTGGGYFSDLENKEMTISGYNWNADGNFQGNWTGGHANNTLEITVFYSIVDL